MASGPPAPAIGCVLIFTRSSKLLVQCAVGSYAQRPVLLAAPLCNLLTAMQSLAGHPPSGFVELHGMRVLLLEGYQIIVALVCGPECDTDSARLIGMQTLNVFGKLFHGQVQELDRAHALEQSAAVESYTFHSATVYADDSTATTSTLPAFASFHHSYLLPLLL